MEAAHHPGGTSPAPQSSAGDRAASTTGGAPSARLLAAGYVLFLAGIVFAADDGKLRGILALVDFIPGGDKAGHFLLMGTLAWLLNAALKRRRVVAWRRRILLGSVITALVVTFEEISQLHFATRHFDLLDLAADYAGILVFSMANGARNGEMRRVLFN